MDDNGRLRRCVRLVRLAPVAMGVITTVHCGLLVFGVKVVITELICSASFTACVILMPLSRAFKLCRLHRLFTLYSLTASCCICVERTIGFGVTLPYARLVMFLIGIILIAILTTRNICE